MSANGAALRTARVLRWSAWAPGIETPDAWRAWCAAPVPLPTTGHPEARFLPAMLRRRCSPLTRIALTAAWGCVDEGQLGRVRTVFASRHGSVNESIEMIEQVVHRQKISPAQFSHTVHNAQAGLFSLAAQNRAASCSIAGRDDTFACGWLEVLLLHLDDRTTIHVPELLHAPRRGDAAARRSPHAPAERPPAPASVLAAAELLRAWIEEVDRTGAPAGVA